MDAETWLPGRDESRRFQLPVANEGRAVYQRDRQVQKVHPCGKRWSGLLKDGLASEC
jgi:hypothetical protein